MTKNNENKNDNSLYAWATGNLASIAIGFAAGTFIYKSRIIQKLTGKFFGKKTDSQSDNRFNSNRETQH